MGKPLSIQSFKPPRLKTLSKPISLRDFFPARAALPPDAQYKIIVVSGEKTSLIHLDLQEWFEILIILLVYDDSFHHT